MYPVVGRARVSGFPRRASIAHVLAALAIIAATLVAATPSLAQTVVTLSGDRSYPDGFTVPAGQVWQFDPSADTTVTVSGNVIVEGTLIIRPSNAAVDHVLRFTGINEERFVGGGMTPLSTDVGLWVVGDGALDIAGTPTTPWAYDWQAGWSSAHDIVAAPNVQGDYTTFAQVDGPGDVPPANALGYQAELLNLSRNVKIEGTEAGKTHIFINSTSPQSIKFAAIRYVAPDFAGTDTTGRYGLHLHHNLDASRGSIIEGVVIRDADNHAFVPHASHGVTFKNTIAFDAVSEAYWWDRSTLDVCGDVPDCNATNDLLYDGVVAAKVAPNPYFRHTGASIQMGAGEDMTIVNSVVVGMSSTGVNNAAFHWPSNEKGVWTFENNVAHNNASNGIFVWQNTSGEQDENHLIKGYTAYYNAKVGVDHGAYSNSYTYEDLTLLGNALGAIDSNALGKPSYDGTTDTQEWRNVVTAGANLNINPHLAPADAPVRFVGCDFGAVVLNEGRQGGAYDFVECDLQVADFDLAGANDGTIIRVQDGATAYQLTGAGLVTAITPFFDVGDPGPDPDPVPPPDPDPPPPDPGPPPPPDPDPPPDEDPRPPRPPCHRCGPRG